MSKRTLLTAYNTKFGKAKAVKIVFTKLGNWNKVESLLQNLDLNLKTSIQWGERKVGERLLKIVKGHLKNQDLPWDPLATGTLWKKHGDVRILIDTETYLDNIKTWQQGGVRYVGVKKGVTEPKSGEEVWRIAQIHEYKSYNGGPFRALWGPSYEDIGGAKGIRAIITEVIYNKLRRLGYNIRYE